MPKLRRYLSWFILGICSIILITACDRGAYLEGNRSPNSSTGDLATSVSSESCRLVSHEMGETEVCGQPQKVAALTPHILDSMLALGVQPAAYAETVDRRIQTYDNPTKQIPYIGKWVTTKPIGLGSRESPSLERLALLQPDLILGEKWSMEDKYPLLTQIAPTLLFSDKHQANEPQSWKQDIKGIAKALGREDRVEELFAAHDEQIAQARSALQPVLQTYPRVFLINSDLSTYVRSKAESTAGRLLKEIGFEIVQPKGIQSDTEISFEIVPKVKTDLIIVLSSDRKLNLFNSPDALQDTFQKRWSNNPLLNSMPVFQQGRVYFVGYQLWGGRIRGPLADRLILEALPDLLRTSLEEKKPSA